MNIKHIMFNQSGMSRCGDSETLTAPKKGAWRRQAFCRKHILQRIRQPPLLPPRAAIAKQTASQSWPRLSLFASRRASLLDSVEGGGEPIVGSPEVLDVLALVIADAPVKVEAVAHGVCGFLGSVDQLFNELGIAAWSWCVVHEEKGKVLKRPRGRLRSRMPIRAERWRLRTTLKRNWSACDTAKVLRAVGSFPESWSS